MAQNPIFTVFIPSYNRAHTIGRALDSIRRQTVSDYEILVVDDGSSDGTGEIVRAWAADSNAEVRYVFQENGGKHAAHNHGVALARGQLFMVLDSDDQLLPDCLRDIFEAWYSIPDERRADYAGVEGLCVTGAGALHGRRFPAEVFDSDYLQVRGRYAVTGEKRNAIRVDVLRQFPYPLFDGEYHIRPDYIWKQISHRYRFRYINRPLHVVDFAPDGLTATASTRRLRNVRGLFAYWSDDIQNHQAYLDRRQRRRNYSEYVRYALHNGAGLRAQYRRVPDRRAWLAALPRALPNYWADVYKKHRLT